MSLHDLICSQAREARAAARLLRRAPTGQKNAALEAMAHKLQQRQAELIAANAKDVVTARQAGLPAAMIDRLKLDAEGLRDMAEGLREVAGLPDPVGRVIGMWKRPNGLQVGRVRIPIGVIGFIYESRPNVTVDAAGLCLKSGNAVILKGGSEAIESNLSLARLMQEALVEAGLPAEAVQFLASTDREAVTILIGLDEFLDLVIPRGGEGLIRFVAAHSRVPVLKHYKGVCHVYVDDSADLGMAAEVCLNAKVQRPGVCNAMETLLVHEAAAQNFLPVMLARFKSAGVEVRGCPATRRLWPEARVADEADWAAEYLDLILAVRVVSDMQAALDHIARYGSNHTEAIVTGSYDRAQAFLSEVDASVVLVNASTRFNDGNQLGLGAEIGISTSKLHAYGPMGLEELTTTKFIVYGQGQTRT